MADTNPTENLRLTRRKYAHELFPDPDGMFDAAPVEHVVPHLYARAIGLNVWGTGWLNADSPVSMARSMDLVNARLIAALADAMKQGKTGQEAYSWAYGVASDESGECVWDRAVKAGIDPYAIRPYPCGEEPEYHYEFGEPDRFGTRAGISTHGKESECERCTIEVQS